MFLKGWNGLGGTYNIVFFLQKTIFFVVARFHESAIIEFLIKCKKYFKKKLTF